MTNGTPPLPSWLQTLTLILRIRERATRLVSPGAGAPLPDGGLLDDAHGLADQVELRLPRLASRFHLDLLAVEAIVCLVAAEYDPYLRHAQRTLQGDGGRPWLEVGTISELLDLPLARMPELAQLFGPDGALRRWALVSVDERAGAPAMMRRAKLADRVAEYLVEVDAPPRAPFQLVEAPASLQASRVPADAARGVLHRLRRAESEAEGLVVEITGAPECGKRYFAEALAKELGHPLLALDLSAVSEVELAEALATARRDALLHDALLCIARWDARRPASPAVTASPAEPDETGAARARSLPAAIARFFADLDAPVLLTAHEREPLLELSCRNLYTVNVPFPTTAQRVALLREALQGQGLETEAGIDLAAISRAYVLDPARTQAAARAAADLHEGDGPVPTTVVAEACRRQMRHDLGSVAVRVPVEARREDLVVGGEVSRVLDELIAYRRHAGRVYDQWGIGARGAAPGISALFVGPPGTGKTLCAGVVARELDLELFRVDLSRVVSKWIGETEKNLERVFEEAERSGAVILFDEADSLFAKRTEVKSSNDRHANLQVNFLLQRIEAFSGVTVLTSNHESAIDEAFRRRLTFRVRFDKPDAAARASLWRKMFPASAAVGGDVSFERLGALYDLSGGSIRNAAIRAAFFAAAAGRAIEMSDCDRAARRECAEMGLLVKDEAAAESGTSARPAESPSQAAGPAEEEVTPARKSSPLLIPVTHPRRAPAARHTRAASATH